MPKKRKSSLGRKTLNAKRVMACKETLNDSDIVQHLETKRQGLANHRRGLSKEELNEKRATIRQSVRVTRANVSSSRQQINRDINGNHQNQKQ